LQAVILAGGEGKRLRPLTSSIPKPMFPISGKPFLEHEINLLKRASINDIVICIGYQGELVRRHFEDGQSLGVRIRYSDDGDKLLGTAGSLKKARTLLSDRFFITFGDAYPILDYKAAWNHFILTGKIALMVVYKNSNRYGRSNTVVQDGLVIFYSKKEKDPRMQYIEFGVTFMNRQALDAIPDDNPVDLEALYRQIISNNQMAALEVNQRIYDIGSPEGLAEFQQLVSSGQVEL
jgi:NDP-sugar pyrophosphorylase family protein